MKEKKTAKKPLSADEVPELRADRDDALGYSREQFVFEDDEEEKDKGEREKRGVEGEKKRRGRSQKRK